MANDTADLRYISGFGAHVHSEALAGALPKTQNSPRNPPYGLYSEQLNGTPFTMRRSENRRAWLYRIRPSMGHGPLSPSPSLIKGSFEDGHARPDLMRWKPLPIPPRSTRVDFVDGLSTLGGWGSPESQSGYGIHLYVANAGMGDRAFYNADGSLLVVPQLGALEILTEFGRLQVVPGEIFLIQRGMKFTVQLLGDSARGYVCEVYSGNYKLPERGPIGANGLADERHFLAPTAWYEERAVENYRLSVKYGGQLFEGTLAHSPYDVVAWHGNYAPYKYDLAMFNTMGTVSWDHPDPSILTVLTVPMDDHGRNVIDFAVFPGRWDVAEHTLRPPFYHRNAATEFNGIIATPQVSAGFEAGCSFVTPPLTAHGINTASYDRNYNQRSEVADAPVRGSEDSLWFMFESAMGLRLTDWAVESDQLDAGYGELFVNPTVHFDRHG